MKYHSFDPPVAPRTQWCNNPRVYTFSLSRDSSSRSLHPHHCHFQPRPVPPSRWIAPGNRPKSYLGSSRCSFRCAVIGTWYWPCVLINARQWSPDAPRRNYEVNRASTSMSDRLGRSNPVVILNLVFLHPAASAGMGLVTRELNLYNLKLILFKII